MNLTSNACNLDLPQGKKVQKAVLFFSAEGNISSIEMA